jgi:BirA family transcriptional regulator, biotin operon repressor / biotin---[acetyl-CoA-carboxylase] ligase
MNFTILTFDTIDSTNTEALKQARLGADEGLCVVARQQTAGRGRHGRSWVSEKDAGLYFSIVLRPKIDTKFLPLITLMTGIAVHDTLHELGIKSDIKWVNDLLVKEKKICGILAETTDTNDGTTVVVGIGINLRSSNFPPEIAETATSIEDALSEPETAARWNLKPRSRLLRVPTPDLTETLTKYLGYFYDILNSENGPSEIIDEWRRRSSYFSGKSVRVVLGNETVDGVTDGLEENGALRVRKNGNVTIIQAGDVEQLRTAR